MPIKVMPAMRTQRVFPAVTSGDYAIFVVGGVSQGKLVGSCEHYSVQSNEWMSLAPLPIAVHGSGAALPNHVKRILHVGFDNQIVDCTVMLLSFCKTINSYLSQMLTIDIRFLFEYY